MKPTVRRFHQLPYRAREWGRSRKLIARVEATALGSDVRFIVTSLEGRGKTLYEKVFCARGNAENLIKDLKRFTRSDKTACSRWRQPVPALPPRRCLLAAAQPAERGAEALALARRDVRDDPALLREARCARRGAERQNQARVPGELPSRHHARRHDRRHHDAGTMSDAARAARAPIINSNAFKKVLYTMPSTPPDFRVQRPSPSSSRIEWASRLEIASGGTRGYAR
jgi:hypothetical protein